MPGLASWRVRLVLLMLVLVVLLVPTMAGLCTVRIDRDPPWCWARCSG